MPEHSNKQACERMHNAKAAMAHPVERSIWLRSHGAIPNYRRLPFRPTGPHQCSADEQDESAAIYSHFKCPMHVGHLNHARALKHASGTKRLKPSQPN